MDLLTVLLLVAVILAVVSMLVPQWGFRLLAIAAVVGFGGLLLSALGAIS